MGLLLGSPTAPPAARVGIIQEITLLDSTFNEHGDPVDGIQIETFDSSDSSAVVDGDGGTWNSNWDTRRANIFTEEGVNGPETDDVLRYRLRYDQNYDSLGNPRNKVFWSPGKFASGFEAETEYWLGWGIFIPSDYEIDGEFGREILLQLHNDSTAPGQITVSIDSGNLVVRERLTATSTVGGTERIHMSQSVTPDKGEIVFLIINWKFNPAATETTITAGMGANAQVDEVMPANTGILRIWKTIAPGTSVTSLDLGTVTNSGGSRAEFLVTNRVNEPVGRVWDWEGGVSPLGSILPEYSLYKPAWFNGEVFADRPAIPHAGSTKDGPIVIYQTKKRWGSASSDYQSVHPLQSAEPT